MNDAWEERERAFEEGYFRQKDNELIAKMKSRISVAAHPEGIGCPKCDGELHTGNFETVQVDVCDKCGGVWLDAGEMAKIVNKADASWLERLFG